MGLLQKVCRKGKNLILAMLCVYGFYSLMALLYLNALTTDAETLKRMIYTLGQKGDGGTSSKNTMHPFANFSGTTSVLSEQKPVALNASMVNTSSPPPVRPRTEKAEPTNTKVKPTNKKVQPQKTWKPVPMEGEYNDYLNTGCVCPPAVKAHEYKLLITSDLCSKDSPYMVTFVDTAMNHQDRRDIIRRTWGSVTSWDGRPIVTVFMLGASTKEKDNDAVMRESEQHGDIVQGDFIDAYRNMTYKLVMGMGWVADNCPTARYVFKADDDPLVNIFDMMTYLDKSPLVDDVIRCHVLNNARPTRAKNKWHTTYSDFYLPQYPSYCEGLGFITTLPVIRKLFQAASTSRFFWVDDVYVSGLLRVKAKINLEGFNRGVFTPKLVQADSEKELFKYFLYRGINLPVALYDKAWAVIMSHRNSTLG